MKQAFIFWPKEKATDNNDTENGATGEKIIDISKWQGDIDFDALKNDVALVILRASCGSDKDVKFDEYVTALKARRIPFGVYCYSYAGTVQKAEDEAIKLVSYAKNYSPLFYVMDAEENKITTAAIETFAKTLKDLGVERIGCYVAHNRYKAYNYDSVGFRFDFTWIPRYGKNDGTVEGATKPDYPCDLWQFTSTGKVDGISGNVDMNIITGSGKKLSWFLGGDS